jgi:uncharacterized membrane protein HdeD (DUF308 family)
MNIRGSPDVALLQSLGKEAAMAQLDRLERAILPAQVGQHWWSYLAEGVLLLVLGLVAIVVPIIASVAFAFFLGVILLIGGVAGGARALFHPHVPGFGWAMLSSLITVVAGMLLVVLPVRGALSLTVVFAVYFLVEGIASIAYAFSHREHIDWGWGWMLLNGVIDIVMATVIAFVLPFVFAALWVLGLMIGIDFIIGGLSLIRMGTAARRQIPVARQVEAVR